jgi:hypothetical protein
MAFARGTLQNLMTFIAQILRLRQPYYLIDLRVQIVLHKICALRIMSMKDIK